MSGPDRDESRALAAASPINHDPDPSLSASRRPEAADFSEEQQQQHQHHQDLQGHGVDGGSGSNINIANNDANLGHVVDDDASRDVNQNAAAASANLPPFEPIFTLLTNSTTNTTVHPHVHYLFSDDDASAVLAAPQTDPQHRALVVDLAPPAAPNGKWTVSWASSLTPDFAITASQLSLQQHGSSSEANDAESTSVVLRVEGVEREPVASRPNSPPSSNNGSGIVGRENVEQLTEEFRRRMGVLKKVVDEGERRKGALARLNPNEEAMAHHDHGEDAAVVHDDAGGRSVPEGQDG